MPLGDRGAIRERMATQLERQANIIGPRSVILLDRIANRIAPRKFQPSFSTIVVVFPLSPRWPPWIIHGRAAARLPAARFTVFVPSGVIRAP